MTLQELYDQLEKHDWFFDFSDDGYVWRRGQAESSRLQAEARKIEGGTDLYAAFHKHHFSGKPWGTEKADKPERPSEN